MRPLRADDNLEVELSPAPKVSTSLATDNALGLVSVDKLLLEIVSFSDNELTKFPAGLDFRFCNSSASASSDSFFSAVILSCIMS